MQERVTAAVVRESLDGVDGLTVLSTPCGGATGVLAVVKVLLYYATLYCAILCHSILHLSIVLLCCWVAMAAMDGDTGQRSILSYLSYLILSYRWVVAKGTAAGGGGKTILFRADLDGLPIPEGSSCVAVQC